MTKELQDTVFRNLNKKMKVNLCKNLKGENLPGGLSPTKSFCHGTGRRRITPI